jgi:hypothetical protein
MILSVLGSVLGTDPVDPIDWGTAFTPLVTEVTNSITGALPVALPVLGILAGIGIAIGLFRKFGVRR